MSFESTCDDPDLIVLQSDSYKKASCRISEEERKVAAFRTALDKTNQDYAELLKKSHHLEEENQKMRYSCQYYYHLYRTAEETISSLKDEISSIGNEKERSEADFDLVLKRTIHINDHNVRELNETVDELCLLRSQISNMTITVRSASNARDHAEQRLERMRATLSQAQRERDIAQRSLDSARSTIQYLEEFVIKNVTHERDQHQLLAEEALQKVEYCRAHHTSNEMQQHLHNQWMHRMSVQAMEIEDMRSTVCLWKEAAHAARANERKTSACLRESQAQLHELRINMDLLSSEAKSLRTSLEDAEADFRIRERRQDTLIKELRRQLTQQSPNCGTTTLDRPSPIMDAQQNASSPCTEPSPTVRGTPVSEKEEVVRSNGRETPPSSKNNPLLHSEEQVKLLTRLADMQEHVWALENAKRATEGEFLRLSEELQKKDKALRACLREQAAQRTSATRVATSQQPQITDNHVTLGVNKNTQPSAEQVASTERAGGSILARWWPLTTNNIHPQGSPMHSSSPHSSEFNRIYMLLEYYTLENCRLEELVDELERKVQKDSERKVDLSG